MAIVIDILKHMPAYVIGLVQDHIILMAILAVLFIFVTFFSNKIANKMRTIFVLASLLMIVFSFISQTWTRIGFIILGLLAMAVIRLIGFIISEIRITRKNKRIAERALEKAAKRRGSWQNKQGYSGARKPIIEPEYVPGKMNREEIEEIIKNEFADKKPEPEVPAAEEGAAPEAEVFEEKIEITEEISEEKTEETTVETADNEAEETADDETEEL